ncbi:MAG: AAA family ATPase [Bacteroidota bacterium]
MQKLVEKSDRLIATVPTAIERSIPAKINWNWRLNAVIGARGTGKTTLLLQRAKQLVEAQKEVLYLTLDDLYFTENSLFDTIDEFQRLGGEYLFVDEVHKYPRWARALKNSYDSFPELIVVFSGSSILEIFRQDVDLSRRALLYELPGLSFREYLEFSEDIRLPIIEFPDLLNHHRTFAADILRQLKPLKYFKSYLRSGYYPFFVEAQRDYHLTLEQVIQLVVESDLRFMDGFDVSYSRKMLQLLRIIARSAPFKPNISKLSERIGISRKTLLQYLQYLEKARLISLLHLPEQSISVLQKPDKIFLNNSNLYYTLHADEANIGSIRETFFQSQLRVLFDLFLHQKVDFMLDVQAKSYLFEIGGRHKKTTQIRELDRAYLVLDDIETGFDNKIPLWLFGFLY